MRLLVSLVPLVAATACSPARPPPAAPAPDVAVGWRKEVIPFPLEFAPELAYRGKEEILFAPKFFDATADTYFTYAFAWRLEGPRYGGARDLERDLVLYFRGLMNEVGKGKHALDAAGFQAHVRELPPAQSGQHLGAPTFEGTIEAFDAFGDGRALHLHVEVYRHACSAEREVLSFAIAPIGSAAWKRAEAVARNAFHCEGAPGGR